MDKHLNSHQSKFGETFERTCRNSVRLFKTWVDTLLGDPTQGRSCAEVASMLGMSDYEVFIRAYEWYYGMSPESVDRAFKEYLLSGCECVPCYVRQFSRNWQLGLLEA